MPLNLFGVSGSHVARWSGTDKAAEESEQNPGGVRVDPGRVRR